MDPRTKKGAPEAPTGPAFDPAEVERMRAEVSMLRRENAALKGASAAAAPVAPEAERLVVLHVRKLNFIGQTRNDKTGVMEPDLRFHELHGLNHTTGRGGSPVMFKGSPDDRRPHAYVHQSFGDWLIENDRRYDAYGTPLAARYEWGEPAPIVQSEPEPALPAQ